MACCCKSGGRSKNSTSTPSCLGRCDLPKHKCLDRKEVKPGRVPKHMGWLYTAKDAPEHQLRCGWRPGHIFCPVLREIERHNCMRAGGCGTCCCTCARSPCCFPANTCTSCCPPR